MFFKNKCCVTSLTLPCSKAHHRFQYKLNAMLCTKRTTNRLISDFFRQNYILHQRLINAPNQIIIILLLATPNTRQLRRLCFGCVYLSQLGTSPLGPLSPLKQQNFSCIGKLLNFFGLSQRTWRQQRISFVYYRLAFFQIDIIKFTR